MILPHRKDTAARQVEFEIGVAAVFRRFDPARRAARLDEPDASIGALADDNGALRRRVGAAAIFMDTAADIEGRRREVCDLAIRAAAAQNRAAILVWPGFEPVKVLAIDAEATKTNRPLGHEFDAHRRDPGAIRGNDPGHRRTWLREPGTRFS